MTRKDNGRANAAAKRGQSDVSEMPARSGRRRFSIPDVVLQVEGIGAPHEYQLTWLKACTDHPYEARELLDRMATAIDQLTEGDY